MRFLAAVAVVAAALSPAVALAQSQEGVMQARVTVVPHCRISVESAPVAGEPTVTASCATSTLRVLRVTTSRGESIRPRTGRRLRAGGDAVFVVSRSQVPDRESRTVVVTLDF